MHKFPEHLLAGYSSFLDGRFTQEQSRYRELAREGQHPSTLIIACCDSRSAPETIFDAGPGELFVLRNIANLVPPYQPDSAQHGTSAAIEFAVVSLEVENIVVMGHGRCGGIHAALSPDAKPLDAGDFIGKWMSMLGPASDEVRGNARMTAAERHTALERISVRNSIANLRTFPYVARLESEGRLALHGAWFDISLGELWVMDPESGDFARPDV